MAANNLWVPLSIFATQKLVNETFQQMWFTPLPVQDSNSLLQRALNIIDVVAASKDTGYDWLEQLLTNVSTQMSINVKGTLQKTCICEENLFNFF